MDPPQGNQPAPQVNQQVPAELVRDSFRDLQLEMRASTLAKQIRDFNGEGCKRYRDWRTDINRVGQALNANDERFKTLAFQSLKGNAGEFLGRHIRQNPNNTWAQILEALNAQFLDDGESHLASQKLRKLSQRTGESVQNFVERILSVAQEAYDNINQPIVQNILVGTLIDGVLDDATAKKLIREMPDTLAAALELAVSEQTASRTFKMRRRPEEPMEVDSLQNDVNNTRISKLENGLGEVVAQMTKILDAVQSLQQAPRPKSNPNWHDPNLPKWSKDGRPICFKCGKIGHMKKHCHIKHLGN